MPQDQFAGYINTEEAADCAVCSVQVTTLRALNDFWFVFTTALSTAEHQAPGHTPAPAITGVRNSGERSQRGFTQFEGFEL